MIKEVNLTDEYLKAITGKFDLETVFNLELVNKSIGSLGSIPKCTSLLYLDLSPNNISSINGLDNLVHIMFLDLSYNKISNISNIGNLRDLINCKLQGNNISGPLPSFFSELRKIEKLCFHEVPIEEKPDVNTSNPICQNENYRQEVLDSIPQLKWLDGIPRGMEAFKIDIEETDNDLKEKLNPNNYNFSFDGKFTLDPEEVLPSENLNIVKRNVQEKYSEFQQCLDQVKKELEEIQ